MYKRIVVAVGDYPELDTAVAYAIALAADSDAELWLLRGNAELAARLAVALRKGHS